MNFCFALKAKLPWLTRDNYELFSRKPIDFLVFATKILKLCNFHGLIGAHQVPSFERNQPNERISNMTNAHSLQSRWIFIFFMNIWKQKTVIWWFVHAHTIFDRHKAVAVAAQYCTKSNANVKLDERTNELSNISTQTNETLFSVPLRLLLLVSILRNCVIRCDESQKHNHTFRFYFYVYAHISIFLFLFFNLLGMILFIHKYVRTVPTWFMYHIRESIFSNNRKIQIKQI